MVSKVLLVALLAIAAAARPVCHNITGTCMPHGFVCISGEVVPHSQRCNGVEDCSDGTDEFLCEHEDHRPLHERTPEERHAFQQATCVNCNCAATAFSIAPASVWFKYAKFAPADLSLMTGAALTAGGRTCNPDCTSLMTIGLYKKNRICRGWLCCIRQRACTTCLTSPAPCTTATGSASKRCLL